MSQFLHQAVFEKQIERNSNGNMFDACYVSRALKRYIIRLGGIKGDKMRAILPNDPSKPV